MPHVYINIHLILCNLVGYYLTYKSYQARNDVDQDLQHYYSRSAGLLYVATGIVALARIFLPTS